MKKFMTISMLCLSVIVLASCSGVSNKKNSKEKNDLKIEQYTEIPTIIPNMNDEYHVPIGYGLLYKNNSASDNYVYVRCYEVARASWRLQSNGYLDELMNLEEFQYEYDSESKKSLKNVDYDRDGTVDRIYMTFETIDNAQQYKVRFRIEFGNGITAELPEFEKPYDVSFFSYDIDEDGEYEIVAFNSLLNLTAGEICIMKKYDNEYRPITFAVDENKEVFSFINVETYLYDDCHVDCYVPLTDYSFKLNLRDYDKFITGDIEKRTPYDAWCSDLSEINALDSGKMVRKLELTDEEISFVKFNNKNSILVHLDLEIPAFSSARASKAFTAVLMYEDGEIKLEDLKEVKN